MKRILSLDGGGIRGMFSLQILARIEELFREKQGKPDLVLADVFDLIAGTSTGAIIATCLSWGMSVREVEGLYVNRGPEMFAKERWYRRWHNKYRADAIAEFFRQLFSERPEQNEPALLCSRRLRTLLLIVMRNASTGSPWPVSNNPHARFNDPALPDCNLKLPLWQLLRASTAAPAYFSPEELDLAGRRSLFVDGGMTPFNNPALIAVLMATLPCYRLAWPTGRETLHVVSVGTGAMRARLPHKVAAKINLLDQIKYLAPALIESASFEQDVLCRVLGDCVYGEPLDLELGTLDAPSLLSPAEQKFTYVRYDRPLDAGRPESNPLSEADVELDNLKLIPFLQQTGRQYASDYVKAGHLHPRDSQAR